MTYLLDIVGGETAIGHSFTGGGDLPDVDNVPIGLLGADYEVVDGGYRIKKILTGENWNPNLRAPLTGPGIDIKEAEVIADLSTADGRSAAVREALEATGGDVDIVVLAAGLGGHLDDGRLVQSTPALMRTDQAHYIVFPHEQNRHRVEIDSLCNWLKEKAAEF